MATEKYDMETADYRTTGWNAIYNAAIEILDEVVHTWMVVTLGEDVGEGEALYCQVNGLFYRALADNIRMPVLGLAIEDGVAGGNIRIQRDGPMTVTSWSFSISAGVWLSDATRGAITQMKPSPYDQFLGIAINSNTVDLRIDIEDTSGYGQTTTTSTTTTSSTSTSSTTTTTTV